MSFILVLLFIIMGAFATLLLVFALIQLTIRIEEDMKVRKANKHDNNIPVELKNIIDIIDTNNKNR